MEDKKCFYGIADNYDEFRQQVRQGEREAYMEVSHMLAHPEAPEWMPRAILDAIKYSCIWDETPLALVRALAVSLPMQHCTDREAFIVSLTIKLNNEERAYSKTDYLAAELLEGLSNDDLERIQGSREILRKSYAFMHKDILSFASWRMANTGEEAIKRNAA